MKKVVLIINLLQVAGCRLGKDSSTKPVPEPIPFPIDGGWSDWQKTEKKCLNLKLIEEERICNNPLPLHGGKDCEGESIKTSIACASDISDLKRILNVDSPPTEIYIDFENLSFLFDNVIVDIDPNFEKIDVSSWSVSQVKDMSYLFYGASAFNQPLDNWDTSNVTDMSDMFYKASVFNQPLGNWNTSNVTDMSHMFYKASVFNHPLGNWNTSNVTDMYNMFYESGMATTPSWYTP